MKSIHENESPSAAGPSFTDAGAPQGSTHRSRSIQRALSRAAYWLPVIAIVVLFAQVSFLGLRPALCEAQRLADADVVLATRHERAIELNRELTAQLQARQDPIFLERQRRARLYRPER